MYKENILFTGKGITTPSKKANWGIDDMGIMINIRNTDFIFESCFEDIMQTLNCCFKAVSGVVVDWENKEFHVYTKKGVFDVEFKLISADGLMILSSISAGSIGTIGNGIMRNIWFAEEQYLFFEEEESYSL